MTSEDFEFGFWRKEGDPQGTPPPPPKIHRYVDRVRIKGDPKIGAIPPKSSPKLPKPTKNLRYSGPRCQEESKTIEGFKGYRVYPNGQVFYRDQEVKPWGSNCLIYLTDRSGYEKQDYVIKLFDLLSYLFLSAPWHTLQKPRLKIQKVKQKDKISDEYTYIDEDY